MLINFHIIQCLLSHGILGVLELEPIEVPWEIDHKACSILHFYPRDKNGRNLTQNPSLLLQIIKLNSFFQPLLWKLGWPCFNLGFKFLHSKSIHYPSPLDSN